MKILALDPANKCGFAHSDGYRGVWLLQAFEVSQGDRSLELSQGDDEHPGRRLRRLEHCLLEAHRDWGFELLAYEDAALGSHNPRTKTVHAKLAGVIELVACRLGVPVLLVNPATLKLFATGNGRATKEQMIRSCEIQFGITTADDNVADALFVLALAEQESRRESVESQKPNSRKKGSRHRRGKGWLFKKWV